MDRNLVFNFKLLILISKWVPFLFAILQFVMIITQFFGIKLIMLNVLFGIPIIPLLYLYLVSYALKFCFYHRISIHYILTSNLLCLYDKYVGIPISLLGLFIIHVIVFVLLLSYLFYFKVIK